MIFYLGTHKPRWLGTANFSLFVSRRTLSRLARKKPLPVALHPWGLDSGGFSELKEYGHWTVTAEKYASEVNYWNKFIGKLKFAAVQDWMCEPFILNKTGLSVLEHQTRTIDSYIRLKSISPAIPWMPVIQGFTEVEYLQHIEAYINRGIDLWEFPQVGLGSICRRQGTREAVKIIKGLSYLGLKIHGFGLKTQAFERGAHEYLVSADSLAWSLNARKSKPHPQCVNSNHKNCANCFIWANDWRNKVMKVIQDSN